MSDAPARSGTYVKLARGSLIARDPDTGDLSVPIEVMLDDEQVGTAPLVLSNVDAEILHAALTRRLSHADVSPRGMVG